VITTVNFHNYGVYQLSRWALCAAAIYGVMNLKSGWQWILGGVALLFNPILPIHSSRDVWQAVDGLAAGVFLASGFSRK